MASAIPNSAKANLVNGTIDLNTHDIRARLVMSNTTCDTEVDAINDLADYSTIDPCNSTGYADVALSSEAVNVDDANNRAEFDAVDVSFTGLGGDASRNIVGVLIYKYVDGTNANDLPIQYVEFTAPIPSTATQIDIPWSTEGILQIA
jgi:hypothetical protein